MKNNNNVLSLILAVIIGLMCFVVPVSACESDSMMSSKFIVLNCIAISDSEFMNVESGYIYSGFENLETFKYYRCAAWLAESECNYDIFDFDLWDTYIRDITNYEHDLSRVDICKKYNDTSIITSDGNIWNIDVYEFLDDNNYYYVFFDKVNTDDYIYDDVILHFMPINRFDIELYELNKMYLSEV